MLHFTCPVTIFTSLCLKIFHFLAVQLSFDIVLSFQFNLYVDSNGLSGLSSSMAIFKEGHSVLTHVLYILISVWVLRTPNSGQNSHFQCFFKPKSWKNAKKVSKTTGFLSMHKIPGQLFYSPKNSFFLVFPFFAEFCSKFFTFFSFYR